MRRLALRVPLARLERVARADFLGRTTADALTRVDEAGAWLLSEAARLDTLAQKPAPILLGRHLVARGFQPGPRFKAILQRAFDAQLEGAFADESGALQWLAASGETP